MISNAIDPDILDLIMQLKVASCMNTRSCVLLVASVKNNGPALKKTLQSANIQTSKELPQHG